MFNSLPIFYALHVQLKTEHKKGKLKVRGAQLAYATGVQPLTTIVRAG